MPDGGIVPLTNNFTPGPDTTREFRNALGKFATGVTVVTCESDEGPVGITANSFASVSLEPPLVLWSPARASRRFSAFEAAEHYAIHVLGADQRDVCASFARHGDDFDGADWGRGENGVPVLNGCLARFECQRAAVHDGGDHIIIIGRVLRAAAGDGDPLLFSAGSYGRFTHGH